MLAQLRSRVRSEFTRWVARRLPAVQCLQLRQRHIFIVPTATGVAFAGAVLLMLLVAINYQNSLAYGLSFLLAALALLSVFHTWRNLAGLHISAAGTAPCFVGEQGVYRLRLHSDTQQRHAIGLGLDAQHLIWVDVPAAGEQVVELAQQGLQRGWQPTPRLRIETRFPFGLFVAWSQISIDQSILVYPQPSNDSLAMIHSATQDHTASQQTSTQVGVDDFQGLTAWQAGDSLRRVHWKAWSKGQGLLIKQFSQQQGQEQRLDFNQLTGGVERRLSMLCAQVLHIAATGQPYTLSLPNQSPLGPAAGAEHRQRCLRALALYGAPV